MAAHHSNTWRYKYLHRLIYWLSSVLPPRPQQTIKAFGGA
jgi:hypothetical protein